MRCARLSVLVLLLASSAVAAASVSAQDVAWTEWSKVEFTGGMGTVMRILAGNGESVAKNYIKGVQSRSDDEDKKSEIVDLANPRFISIDHKAKTFTIMTFAQMEEYMRAMSRRADSAMAQARGQSAPATPPASEPQAQMDVRVDLKVEKTGEKQRILGYDAERQLVIVETEAMVTPEGGGEAQAAGRLVLLYDIWSAPGVPIEQAQMRMVQNATNLPQVQNHARSGEGLAAAFTADPKVRAAMEKATKELEKLEGYELKSTMHVVIVPPGLTFDREKALADESGGGGGAGPAVRRGLGGMVRGALGNRGQQPPPQPEPTSAPTQATMVRVRSEVRELKTSALAASLFEPPAGYKEIPWAMPR